MTGLGAVVGDEIVSHPAIRGIGFTGSPATGQKIAERGAGKPMLLELGGNGPFVVLADADIDAAVDGIVFSAYFNSGQACSATERVLVAASVKDELIEKLLKRTAEVKLGDPFADDTTMGPLNNAAVAEKMDRHIADAVSRGAQVVAGGQRAAGLGSNLSLFSRPCWKGSRPRWPCIARRRSGRSTDHHVRDERGGAAPRQRQRTWADLRRLHAQPEGSLLVRERIRTGIVNINETPKLTGIC